MASLSSGESDCSHSLETILTTAMNQDSSLHLTVTYAETGTKLNLSSPGRERKQAFYAGLALPHLLAALFWDLLQAMASSAAPMRTQKDFRECLLNGTKNTKLHLILPRTKPKVTFKDVQNAANMFAKWTGTSKKGFALKMLHAKALKLLPQRPARWSRIFKTRQRILRYLQATLKGSKPYAPIVASLPVRASSATTVAPRYLC